MCTKYYALGSGNQGVRPLLNIMMKGYLISTKVA